MSHELQHEIGATKAIQLCGTGWWEHCTHYQRAKFQLFTAELSMPFSEFHKSLEEAIGRPVFTHELGLNLDGIIKEFLGEKPAPNLREIIELIPEEKRIIVQT